ncbi:hypothetical protein BCR32DRAFT_240270 [Anaeromyces robustus]|uniref:Uncharacterized protein n=1 Tax=Anaeromyces robustus TaxID=1754192 RepID=A0A1Y1XNH8_9FUNG|nr:hypothetical protein BCR32DRAFT_240270 [Anaeromyces robustus]|eukprot:ORX87281.1 hypothetical protein BCR32DRAFT_240270 [Anaeromyces robustus]
MDETLKQKKNSLNDTISPVIDHLDNSFQNEPSPFIFPDPFILDNQNINYDLLNNYSTKIKNINPLLPLSLNHMMPSSIPISSLLPSPQTLDPILLLNSDLNSSSEIEKYYSSNSSSATKIISPSFTSSNYDNSLPSPSISPSYGKYSFNNFAIHLNQNQQIMNSLNNNNTFNGKQTTIITPHRPTLNDNNTSINNSNNNNDENNYNNSFDLDLFLNNQNSTPLDSYLFSSKNQMITPNTNPKKKFNENTNINFYQNDFNSLNKDFFDSSLSLENTSPLLSPIININNNNSNNNKNLLNRPSPFTSNYNQFMNDSPQTQKNNEDMINKYFNFNTNSYLPNTSSQEDIIPNNNNFNNKEISTIDELNEFSSSVITNDIIFRQIH